MQSAGFNEEQAAYTVDNPNRLVGQIRRLGEAGPAYQVMSIDADGMVHVELIHNDEKLAYPLAEILDDPLAETIP